RIIRHLSIAAAPKPASPHLAQMAHGVRKHVTTPALDESKEAVGKVQAPTFGMSLLQFLDQFSGVANAIAKRQTFFGPVRNRNLAAIELPAKVFVLVLVGQLQEPSPYHPLGRAAQPPGPEPSKNEI